MHPMPVLVLAWCMRNIESAIKQIEKRPRNISLSKADDRNYLMADSIIAALFFIVTTEIKARQHEYEREAQALIKDVELRWNAQEAVLSGFASFQKP